MKRLNFVLIAIIGIMLLCGCQGITHREYYEPDDSTLNRVDGFAYGAVKIETIKSGASDFSDGKSVNISAF